MRALLGRFAHFLRWLVAPENLEASVPSSSLEATSRQDTPRQPSPRAALPVDDGSPRPVRRSFLSVLFAPETLPSVAPEDASDTADDDRPGGRGFLSLFASERLPAPGPSQPTDLMTESQRRGISLRWLFQTEQLDREDRDRAVE